MKGKEGSTDIPSWAEGQRPQAAQYRRVLVQFADHLTFHREYGKFLQQKNISRTVLRDAILWCLGSVIATSKFLEE